MIERRRPDVLTLSAIFYDLSLSRDLLSKAEIREFGAAGTEGLKIACHNIIVLIFLVHMAKAGRDIDDEAHRHQSYQQKDGSQGFSRKVSPTRARHCQKSEKSKPF